MWHKGKSPLIFHPLNSVIGLHQKAVEHVAIRVENVLIAVTIDIDDLNAAGSECGIARSMNGSLLKRTIPQI